MLAKMAATVDEISGGRLILGLGSGWNQVEYDAFGYPFDKRVSRFSEEYQIITDLIRTGATDFSGTYHRSSAKLIPPARAELPIKIGSSGPRTLTITASTMDWWNEWWSRFNTDPGDLADLIETVDQTLTDAGRDPAEITKSVAVLVSLDGPGRLMGADATENPITGSIDSIGEQLSAFVPLVDHMQLVVDPITVDTIEALAPVVRAIHARNL
jgi:alkanesulfonate monooxygenase SsuD/methylene tetrahydromethanopterin reductase-like flavin-dependent oxidoreductase (luciferase family)